MVMLTTLTCAVVASAGPAAAATPLGWPDPDAMSTLEALLVFGGIPLALVVGISVFAMAPSIAKGPRYRPGREWWAEPQWFGGPGELEDAEPAQITAGGQVAPVSAAGATAARVPTAGDTAAAATARVGGGAGARW